VGLVKAAENKAKEIDEQYKISEQSKVVIDAGLQKAKEVDESLQISATTKQIVGEVAKQVKSVDDQLQISNTVKSTIETVDEKAGISKKFKEVDSQYQLTDKVQGVMGAAKNAVLSCSVVSENSEDQIGDEIVLQEDEVFYSQDYFYPIPSQNKKLD
jgi:hypothetical protein